MSVTLGGNNLSNYHFVINTNKKDTSSCVIIKPAYIDAPDHPMVGFKRGTGGGFGFTIRWTF